MIVELHRVQTDTVVIIHLFIGHIHYTCIIMLVISLSFAVRGLNIEPF